VATAGLLPENAAASAMIEQAVVASRQTFVASTNCNSCLIIAYPGGKKYLKLPLWQDNGKEHKLLASKAAQSLSCYPGQYSDSVICRIIFSAVYVIFPT